MSVAAKIVLVVTLQTLALGAMVARKQYTLTTGTEVVLATRPVDPRSLFRGDYVRLRYLIGDLELVRLAGDDEFQRGEPVHVVLRPGPEHWEAVAAHRQRPPPDAGQVVLKGRVERSTERSWNADRNAEGPVGPRLRVRYGIESYFVPEGEGLALERPPPGAQVSIRIAVDRYGSAGITAVLLDGVVRYRETLF